jgi:hypothetical protein
MNAAPTGTAKTQGAAMLRRSGSFVAGLRGVSLWRSPIFLVAAGSSPSFGFVFGRGPGFTLRRLT